MMAGGGGQGQGGGAAAARRGAAPHAAGHHARGAPATLGSVDTPHTAPAGVLIARRGTQPRLLELRRSTRRSLFQEITYVRAKRLASRARHAVGCTGLSPTPWTWAPYACLLCGMSRQIDQFFSRHPPPLPPRSMVHRSSTVVPWFSPFTRGARLCAPLRAKPH